MYDLILYDTSNFEDFPIGGQLTSIRNFLKYIAVCRREYAPKILLIGVTTKADQVGVCTSVEIDGVQFAFLPVLYRDSDLSRVQNSLRLEYVKALLKMGCRISISRTAVHYIHTPEAYIAVKLLHPAAKTAVFSHGSFFNMVQGFRFFQKNRIIHVLFNQFLILLLKTADLILTLDDASMEQYRKYTKKVFRGENSIVLPDKVPDRQFCHEPIRLLFVGRLSKVKGIGQIIEAVADLKGQAHLTIVGDGEERSCLEEMIEKGQLERLVHLEGACTPDRMKEYYIDNDILIMNSAVEGKPMVILEAMSYGLPIISTPVGGIPELMRGGMEGEFTDGTPEQITRCVAAVKENYSFYAENAVKCAIMYDYRHVNKKIFEVITS